MGDILYIFITCKNNFVKSHSRIIKMMNKIDYKDYIIVLGGINDYYNLKNKILFLKCNDNYEGLPEKIIKTYNFIYRSNLYIKYKYICKCDDDIIIKKLIESDKLYDYCGNLRNSYIGDREWHIGKCSKNSIYNNKKYEGEYVPWCLGGYGYIISTKILHYIINEKKEYKDEIYEDLYIAKILYKNNIFPKHINIKEYLYSEDHQ